MARLDNEHGVIGRIASSAAESAAENIRRYIELHSENPNGPVKPVNRVMKIAEELDASQRKAIVSSVRAAIASLKEFQKELED